MIETLEQNLFCILESFHGSKNKRKIFLNLWKKNKRWRVYIMYAMLFLPPDWETNKLSCLGEAYFIFRLAKLFPAFGVKTSAATVPWRYFFFSLNIITF